MSRGVVLRNVAKVLVKSVGRTKAGGWRGLSLVGLSWLKSQSSGECQGINAKPLSHSVLFEPVKVMIPRQRNLQHHTSMIACDQSKEAMRKA